MQIPKQCTCLFNLSIDTNNVIATEFVLTCAMYVCFTSYLVLERGYGLCFLTTPWPGTQLVLQVCKDRTKLVLQVCKDTVSVQAFLQLFSL